MRQGAYDHISKASPSNPEGRIISLDVLRGVAVLGILIMNIQSFSMPGAAYINPTVYGDLSGMNKWVWILSHILANGKFMAIFSILFGAGICLFASNAEAKGKNVGALHFRRMAGLLIFGLMHSYLLWTGDILVAYSLCGMLVFPLRKQPPLTLLKISMALFLVPVIIYVGAALTLPYWPERIVDLANSSWKPGDQAIQHSLAVSRGSWMEQMKYRVPAAFSIQTRHFFIQSFWRLTAMILLGMALFKWKVLSAGRSRGFYQRMTLAGLTFGLVITILGVVLDFRAHWSMEFSRLLGSRMNYVGSLSMALGYIGIIILICKSAQAQAFKKLFASVGKMALSNYILMTLLATFLFFGHGLGLFGKVERTGQMGFVLAIWIIILLLSKLWLAHFKFGPLEALWRKFTYLHLPLIFTRVSERPA